MLPTESSAERRLYEGFLEQLDDSYVVYHSVDWVMAPRPGAPHTHPEQGEADFVIVHPDDGVLALEAKGGTLLSDPVRVGGPSRAAVADTGSRRIPSSRRRARSAR